MHWCCGSQSSSESCLTVYVILKHSALACGPRKRKHPTGCFQAACASVTTDATYFCKLHTRLTLIRILLHSPALLSITQCAQLLLPKCDSFTVQTYHTESVFYVQNELPKDCRGVAFYSGTCRRWYLPACLPPGDSGDSWSLDM